MASYIARSASRRISSAVRCGLIYFDDASRRVAAENLFEALAPGGFICLGHTESMSRISPLFEVRRFPDAIVYQRPPAGGNGGRPDG